jgi:hypothetical protein
VLLTPDGETLSPIRYMWATPSPVCGACGLAAVELGSYSDRTHRRTITLSSDERAAYNASNHERGV